MTRFLALTFLFLTACSQHTAEPVAENVANETQPAKPLLVIHDSQADASSITALNISNPTPRTFTYRITAGDNVPQQLTRTTSPSTEFNSTWKELEPGRRTQYFTHAPDGSLLLTAVEVPADNAISIFDPPMLVCPAELKSRDTFRSSGKMKVVDAKNHARQRESGTYTRIIENVRGLHITSPLGNANCQRIEVTFKADLKLANAVKTSILYIDPSIGIISEEWSEEITILGGIKRRSAQTIVLEKIDPTP